MTKHSSTCWRHVGRTMLVSTQKSYSSNQEKINFYGHTLTEKGIQPAEYKLQAIKNIKVPANAAELHTILGMVNYLNRFSVKLAEYTAPLRELTKKHVHFRWEPYHQAALDRIKKELSSPRIISFYYPNPATPTILTV